LESIIQSHSFGFEEEIGNHCRQGQFYVSVKDTFFSGKWGQYFWGLKNLEIQLQDQFLRLESYLVSEILSP
jgi:hypothetical protein